jgi:hypothetical protein
VHALLTIEADTPSILPSGDAATAEIAAALQRDRTPLIQAIKRLRCGCATRDQARTIAVALVMWPPWLTDWEVEFLYSTLHLRRDPTPKQQEKLRQITRNPTVPAVILRRLMRAGQRSRRR